MMNYDKLKQKASKGPFDVYGLTVGSANNDVVADLNFRWGTKARHEANAQLIAHCLNTYDELLEALEVVERASELWLPPEAVSPEHEGEAIALNMMRTVVLQALKNAKEV